MKNPIHLIALLLIVSCAPKHTASFRDNHYVYPGNDNHVVASAKNVTVSEASLQLLPKEVLVSVENKPAEFKSETRMGSSNVTRISQTETRTLKKQTKNAFKASVKELSNAEPVKEGDARKNWMAVVGITCSIIGIFVPMIFIPGIVFSAMGLKSEKRKLAVAGLAIGIIAFIVQLVLFASAYYSSALLYGWL